MTTNEDLVRALEARDITPHDLKDIVHALILDKHAPVMAKAADEAARNILAKSFGVETTTLTAAGLRALVDWMESYYNNNRESLIWALSGYLNLPLAA
jgi:predicted RecB family endonuclease